MAKKKEIAECVYYQKHPTGINKYHARILRGYMPSGGFPSVDALKKWANKYAKAQGITIKFKKIAPPRKSL